MPEQTESQRAVVTYRTKELKAQAKWSLWFQREIPGSKNSTEVMTKFYDGYTWPAMTGQIEVKGVTWPDAENGEPKELIKDGE